MGGVDFTEYRFPLENFAKSVKHKRGLEKLDKWVRNLKPIDDEIIAKAVHPFQTIQARMDNMEHRINQRLDALSLPDLANSWPNSSK